MLEHEFSMQARTRSAKGVQVAYAKGQLPRRNEVSFAYMWRLIRTWARYRPLASPFDGLCCFAPYYDNSLLGNNEFGGAFSQLSDDAGTPFVVVVIRVDDGLAIKMRP
jgi:hypothetical protein